MGINEVSKKIQRLVFKTELPDGWETWLDGKHIFGFDNGGGNNSCAEYCKNPDRETREPFRMLRDGFRAEGVYSLLGYGEDPSKAENAVPFVGKAAKNKPFQAQNFKAPPTKANLDGIPPTGNVKLPRRKLLMDYISCLFKQFVIEIGGKLRPILDVYGKENVVIAVGRPSGGGWDDPQVEQNLKDIVKESTGCGTVFVVPESRAALLYEHFRNHAIRGKKLLILDLGAFSIDYTYLEPGKKPKEDSMELGGHRIEENLIKCVDARYNKNLQGNENALFMMRLCKEKLYTALQTNDNAAETLQFGNDTFTITKADLDAAFYGDPNAPGRYEFDAPYLNAAAGVTPGTWRDHLIRFLGEIEQKIGDRSIDTIVVTGGAANMTQAQDEIRTYFADAQFESHRTKDISFPTGESNTNRSVSGGCVIFLHTALRVLKDLPTLRDDLAKSLRKDFIPLLANDIANQIVDYLFQAGGVMQTEVNAWRNNISDSSICGLTTHIKSTLGTWTHESAINSIIWQSTNNEDFLNDTLQCFVDFCKNHFAEGNPQLPKKPAHLTGQAGIIRNSVSASVQNTVRQIGVCNFDSVLLKFLKIIKEIKEEIKKIFTGGNNTNPPLTIYTLLDSITRKALAQKILSVGNRQDFKQNMADSITAALCKDYIIDPIACGIIEESAETIRNLILCN